MNDTVTVTAIDGTTHDITVTITGINDAAVVSGDDQGAVTEDNDPATLTDTGLLSIRMWIPAKLCSPLKRLSVLSDL